MRRYIFFLIGLFILSPLVHADNITIDEMADKIERLGQAGVRIEAGGKVIYIDPCQIKNEDKADFIFITHNHPDHLSAADIAKITGADTVFVISPACRAYLEDINDKKIYVLEPGQKLKLEGMLIEAVPAYNIVKTNYHPQADKNAGYILTVGGVRIYHTGDTERIPEMKKLRCDIIMLPLGRTYTMNSVEEAAECALDVRAKIAIPLHYGLYEGSAEDAEKFREILKGKTKVIIKKTG